MNKTDLVKEIAKRAEFTKSKAGNALDATLEAIQDALVDGEKVVLVGFGTYSRRTRAPRKAINPQTGEEMQIPEQDYVHFKVGKTLKEAVRGSG